LGNILGILCFVVKAIFAGEKKHLCSVILAKLRQGHAAKVTAAAILTAAA
jgi:hypothetical protein